jgi:hypothetical protein
LVRQVWPATRCLGRIGRETVVHDPQVREGLRQFHVAPFVLHAGSAKVVAVESAPVAINPSKLLDAQKSPALRHLDLAAVVRLGA